MQIDEGYLSAPEAVEFPTEGGLTAHMNFYAPRNKVRCKKLSGKWFLRKYYGATWTARLVSFCL